MIDYYERIPSAALRRMFDGQTYAYVGHKVGPNGVAPCPARMVRATDARIVGGEAWVWIGAMGDAIAQRVNLPFAISLQVRA